MKAIVKLQPGDGFVELVEKEEPSPGRGEVKIKVEAAGICGTDIKIRAGHAWSNPPVVLCHEFSGTVAALGDGVTSVAVGDRVVSETAQVICGHCHYCKTNNDLMCRSRLSIGYGVDGAFANFIVVRDGILHKIPDGVSFDEAALCEPSAVAVHAVYDSVQLRPTDRVLFFGPGAIGLLVGQTIRSFGCEIICVGTQMDEQRLRLAAQLGFECVINAEKENVSEVVKQITNDRGVDYVFECSGAKAAILAGMELLKPKGTMVQVGLTQPTLEIPYALLPQREIAIRGTFGHNWLSWEIALQLIRSGKVRVKPLISHVFPIAEWEKAFETAEKQQGVKILIHPNE